MAGAITKTDVVRQIAQGQESVFTAPVTVITGDANMRSVWICSRNDSIGNAAVVLAALGVFGTGTGWPDIIVAAIMAALGISGGWQIVRQAQGELRGVRHVPAPVAAE